MTRYCILRQIGHISKKCLDEVDTIYYFKDGTEVEARLEMSVSLARSKDKIKTDFIILSNSLSNEVK